MNKSVQGVVHHLKGGKGCIVKCGGSSRYMDVEAAQKKYPSLFKKSMKRKR